MMRINCSVLLFLTCYVVVDTHLLCSVLFASFCCHFVFTFCCVFMILFIKRRYLPVYRLICCAFYLRLRIYVCILSMFSLRFVTCSLLSCFITYVCRVCFVMLLRCLRVYFVDLPHGCTRLLHTLHFAFTVHLRLHLLFVSSWYIVFVMFCRDVTLFVTFNFFRHLLHTFSLHLVILLFAFLC